MKKLTFIICFVSAFIHAQDIHFSQINQTQLLINPASAGVYDGWERVSINHRNQWLGAGTQFMTSSFAADVNFFKNQLNNKAHLGVGILFYNDIGGDSNYGMQAGSLTLSGILPLRSGSTLSAGIQGGFGNRKADFTTLTFSSQWTGTQFDQSIISGEANGIGGYKYLDASAGIYYVFDGSKSTFRRRDNFKFQIGAAGYHLNNPTLHFASVDGGRLYQKYVFHSALTTDLSMSKWSVDMNAAQFIQGPHYETILGLIMRYRFKDGTKITGYSQDSYFGFGAYYRFKDAVCPAIQMEYKGFKVGMSYDVTVSTMRKAYAGGSLEFSLSYTNMSHALFKLRHAKY